MERPLGTPSADRGIFHRVAHLWPAHAGPAIQVIMDISGVAISCATCAALFSFFGAPGAPAGAPPAPDGLAAP